jgi:hypothetical protein
VELVIASATLGSDKLLRCGEQARSVVGNAKGNVEVPSLLHLPSACAPCDPILPWMSYEALKSTPSDSSAQDI